MAKKKKKAPKKPSEINRMDALKAIQMNRYSGKVETTMRQPYERPRKPTARKPKSKGETR